MLRNVKLVPVDSDRAAAGLRRRLATWLYFKQYRPDQQTDPDVARAVVSAASDGTVALLSYSPDIPR